MFRASEIFGRKPAKASQRKPDLPERIDALGPRSRAWDPATGRFVEEEIPADVRQLMGQSVSQQSPAKRVKTEAGDWRPAANRRPQEPLLPPPSQQGPVRVLGPASLGLSTRASASSASVKTEDRPKVESPVGPISTDAPSVEYFGFAKEELNDRYYEKSSVKLHERSTYWNKDGSYFIYWQGSVSRWAFCDATSYASVVGGQYPGWAYKQDDHHLSEAAGWMEISNNSWRAAEIEVWTRSSSHHAITVESQGLHRLATSVMFTGFAMQELNTSFHIRPEVLAQGQSTYWDPQEKYFIYWQQENSRWAICDDTCMDDVQKGLAPGWAYRKDSQHFGNAAGWIELRHNDWSDAQLETAVGVRPDSAQLIIQAEREVELAVAEGAGGLQAEDDAEAPEDVPEMKARDYAILIQAVYEEVNPKKLSELARLLQKYRARERELFFEVCQKYALRPNVFYHKNARKLTASAV
mmetsp:Transcript_17395/g.40627  ORF Transcript_17395/g.40627 Transcript_17395/m.40627 type:complete len:467 (-) Transcript_17395:150-1550(-)